MQAVPFIVVHDLQDMRMAADEQLWLMRIEQGFGVSVVRGRITANMRHQHFDLPAMPHKRFGNG